MVFVSTSDCDALIDCQLWSLSENGLSRGLYLFTVRRVGGGGGDCYFSELLSCISRSRTLFLIFKAVCFFCRGFFSGCFSLVLLIFFVIINCDADQSEFNHIF